MKDRALRRHLRRRKIERVWQWLKRWCAWGGQTSNFANQDYAKRIADNPATCRNAMCGHGKHKRRGERVRDKRKDDNE